MATKAKDKSIAVAIGLNVFLTGLGYIYMGRVFLGIFAFLIVCSVGLLNNPILTGATWLSMNLMMAIDMVILHNKYKRDSLKPCPQCAEMVQKEAKKCRYCGAEV